MNAYILHGINQLRYEQTDKPVPGPGEVLLQIKACGICGSDIPRIYRTGAHSHPLIPGHEFAGIVAEAGEQAEELYWNHQGNSAEGKQEKRTLIGKRMGLSSDPLRNMPAMQGRPLRVMPQLQLPWIPQKRRLCRICGCACSKPDRTSGHSKL